MAQLHINTGSLANRGTADTLRGAFIKTEKNFSELYSIASSYPYPYVGTGLIGGNLGIEGTLIVGDTIEGVKIKTTNTSIPQNNYNSPLNPDTNFYVNTSALKSLRFETDDSSYFTINNNIISKGVDLGFSFSTFYFTLNGTNSSLMSFWRTSSSQRIGIGTSYASELLEINGSVSSSAYIGENLPTSDPQEEGQWFITGSDALGLDPGFDVICISQG